ncbi:hypothetical protein O5823_01685 [Escherichia coli]|nr:hypothetical protein [Escherichia coli]
MKPCRGEGRALGAQAVQAGRLAEAQGNQKENNNTVGISLLRQPVFEIRTAVRADGGEGQYTDRR